MSLYAIGDLHLSLNSPKPMDVFGGVWGNYVNKIENGFSNVTQDDVTVICGDLTWAMTLEEALEDFKFIDRLPGRKIILKGNHDYWWSTVTKAMSFFAKNGLNTIDILHNNSFAYGDAAICGTRGWFYEEETHGEHDKKIMSRELMRLEASLRAAGSREKLCFLHYPPRFNNYICHEIVELFKTYGVKKCCYGHIHNTGHNFAVQGVRDGVEYIMVSSDYIDFKPEKIM